MITRAEAVLDPFEGTCYILTAGREDATVACASVVGNNSDEASGLDIVSCSILPLELALYSPRSSVRCLHRPILRLLVD